MTFAADLIHLAGGTNLVQDSEHSGRGFLLRQWS